MDACHWNNSFCSGLWKHWRFISCDLHQMHLMGFSSNSKWFCVKSLDFAAVRVCLFVCVCVTGPGRGHTAWQTAMRNRPALAHRMRRIPQNFSVTSPFLQEPRGERLPLYNSILIENGQKRIHTDVSKQNVLPSQSTRPPTQSHTFESSLLI